MSKEQTSLNTIPEAGYMSDFVEGERLRHEQESHRPFKPLSEFSPGVGDEGSWINRKHRKK